jgi:hypothetical protein
VCLEGGQSPSKEQKVLQLRKVKADVEKLCKKYGSFIINVRQTCQEFSWGRHTGRRWLVFVSLPPMDIAVALAAALG